MPGEKKDEMVWSVTTHEHRERSTDWYWALAVGSIAAAVVSVFFGNILFAVVIVLGMGSIGYLAARGPREHMVKIDDRGVSIDGTRYLYATIHSFWVEHETSTPRLFLTLGGIIAPHFSLTLDNEAQGAQVREHLQKHVREEEQGPHLGEHLSQIFGL
jgi:hypothetical protein